MADNGTAYETSTVITPVASLAIGLTLGFVLMSGGSPLIYALAMSGVALFAGAIVFNWLLIRPLERHYDRFRAYNQIQDDRARGEVLVLWADSPPRRVLPVARAFLWMRLLSPERGAAHLDEGHPGLLRIRAGASGLVRYRALERALRNASRTLFLLGLATSIAFVAVRLIELES